MLRMWTSLGYSIISNKEKGETTITIITSSGFLMKIFNDASFNIDKKNGGKVLWIDLKI